MMVGMMLQLLAEAADGCANAANTASSLATAARIPTASLIARVSFKALAPHNLLQRALTPPHSHTADPRGPHSLLLVSLEHPHLSQATPPHLTHPPLSRQGLLQLSPLRVPQPRPLLTGYTGAAVLCAVCSSTPPRVLAPGVAVGHSAWDCVRGGQRKLASSNFGPCDVQRLDRGCSCAAERRRAAVGGSQQQQQ